MRQARLGTAMLAAVTTTTFLSGCGSDATSSKPAPTATTSSSLQENDNAELSAADLEEAAYAALRQAEPYRAVVNWPGERQRVTMVLGGGSDYLKGVAEGAPFEAVQSSDVMYAKFSQLPGVDGATWAAFEKCLGGRWISARVTDPSMRSLSGMTRVVRSMSPSGFAAHSKSPTKGPVKTIGGVEAIALEYATGGTVWIQRNGQPLPIFMEGKPGTVRYSAFGQAAPGAEIPSPAQAIALTDLQAGRC